MSCKGKQSDGGRETLCPPRDNGQIQEFILQSAKEFWSHEITIEDGGECEYSLCSMNNAKGIVHYSNLVVEENCKIEIFQCRDSTEVVLVKEWELGRAAGKDPYRAPIMAVCGNLLLVYWGVDNNQSVQQFMNFIVIDTREAMQRVLDWQQWLADRGIMFDVRGYHMTDYLRCAYESDEKAKIDATHLEQIEFLLSIGCNMNVVDLEKMYGSSSDYSNCLNITLNYGDFKSAQYFIDKGINLKNLSRGVSPLAIAARKNNLSIVKQLLEKGLDVNRLGEKRSGEPWEGTPLTYCADVAKKEMVELLLNSGAAVNVMRERGRTALMDALYSNQDIAVAETLIRGGADVNILDSSGYDVIYYVTKYQSSNEDKMNEYRNNINTKPRTAAGDDGRTGDCGEGASSGETMEGMILFKDSYLSTCHWQQVFRI